MSEQAQKAKAPNNMGLLRTEAKYLKKELAALLQVDYSTYRNWEAGRKIPSFPQQRKLESTFSGLLGRSISIEYILGKCEEEAGPKGKTVNFNRAASWQMGIAI